MERAVTLEDPKRNPRDGVSLHPITGRDIAKHGARDSCCPVIVKGFCFP